MKASIFYSWQSDLPTVKKFIQKAIDKGIKKLNKDSRLLVVLDRDTTGEYGSPNIVDTVFAKIDRSRFFICDLSFVGQQNSHPNENVLIELGYAIKSLGWDRIICLFDSSTGCVENLPFDINHNRITKFNSSRPEHTDYIANIVYKSFKSLFDNGQLFNPVEDHLKEKIDYIVLAIMRNVINLFRFGQNINYSSVLTELGDMDASEMSSMLSKSQTLGFYYYFDYRYYRSQLEGLFDKLISTDSFDSSWREAVVNFIDWIDLWTYTVDNHFAPSLLHDVGETDYEIQDMHSENHTNPPNSVLLLKHISEDKYQVIQGGFLSHVTLANHFVILDSRYATIVTKRIQKFISCVNFWMEQSGYEMILDPHYFTLRTNPQ